MVNLQNLHTFAFNVEASSIFRAKSIEDLNSFDYDESCLFLGGGSNIAFIEDFSGTILCYEDKSLIVTEAINEYQVKVGSGYPWHQLVQELIKRQINGLENLALIPGMVGAAPIQNIGAYGADFSQFCDYVEVYDFKSRCQRRLSATECQFGYRDSIFKRDVSRHLLITSVSLRLNKNWSPNLNYKGLEHLTNEATANEVFNAVVAIREAKLPDPCKLGNAGSFFKNPIIAQSHYADLRQQFPDLPGFETSTGDIKIPAAWCIDNAGFKGKRVGGIAAYDKQPLVLVNLGNGTGEQLLSLARDIKRKVFDDFKVILENEVTLMGAQGKIEL